MKNILFTVLAAFLPLTAQGAVGPLINGNQINPASSISITSVTTSGDIRIASSHKLNFTTSGSTIPGIGFTTSGSFINGVQAQGDTFGPNIMMANAGLGVGAYATGNSPIPLRGLVVSGNFGVGTSAPATTAEVEGSASFGSGVTKSTFSSTGALTLASGAAYTGAGTGLSGTAASLTAGNVTTNANLTGNVTSVGNATTLAVIPAISGAALTGTAASFTAGNVTTNANLTGDVTSVGNAATNVKASNGFTIIGQNTVTSTETIQGANFSVGGSSFVVSGGSATVAYALTVKNIIQTGTGNLITRQVLTSGSGATYTTPTSPTTPRQLRIRMVGGGGGGASCGTSATAGATGSSTTFNSINAAGGPGGAAPSTGSGIAPIGAGLASFRQVGSQGGQSLPVGAGGFGGSSLLGSGARYVYNNANGLTPDSNNNGGGGGGGGCTATPTGGGGAGGEYVEYIINSPSANYTYTIGAGGTGSSAGGTANGGTGGNGVIIVDEFY